MNADKKKPEKGPKGPKGRKGVVARKVRPLPKGAAGRKAPPLPKGKAPPAKAKVKRGRHKAPPRPIGEAERSALQQAEALALRAGEKLSYRAIAERMGISVSTAYDLVEGGMKEIRERLAETGWDIQQQKFHAVELLQDLVARYHPIATASGILREKMEDGTVVLTEEIDAGIDASMVVVNAVKEIAKMLGLNAAVKVSGKVEHQHRAVAPLEELAGRVEKLGERHDLVAALLPAYAGSETSKTKPI